MNENLKSNDKFALFALICGMIAIPMSMGIFPGVLFGVAAITLGILSRVNYEHFNLNSILGITFGGIAIFLSSVVLLWTTLLLHDPEVMAQLSEIMKMYYGE